MEKFPLPMQGLEECLIDKRNSVRRFNRTKMAAASKTSEWTNESKDVALNKKIAELKKRIILTEGQKKATYEEWMAKEKKDMETISELKKEIKDLTTRLINRINGTEGKYSNEESQTIRSIKYPPGADTAQKALEIYDLQIINQIKKLDLHEAEIVKRKEYHNKLLRQRAEMKLIAGEDGDQLAKSQQNPLKLNQAPLTIEEDESRKLVCRLENEILRVNVQWSQAEHIRKKYKAIKASLMTDAEKFEKKLLELENAFQQQKTDIEKMKKVHHEAIGQRDTMKMVVMRHEHNTQSTAKARSKSACELRRQVDEHKQELERLERKLLTSTKNLVQHGSTESLMGDGSPTGKASPLSARPNNAADQLETTLKLLMQVTGATSPFDVLKRFNAQKEAATRLNYLRTVTESEKRQLEVQRDELTAQLESLQFSDTKENEVNQEYLEQLKKDINEQQAKENEFMQKSNRSMAVLNSIKSTLIDLIQKLHDFDSKSNDCEINENTPSNVLLQLLEERLKQGLMMTGGMIGDADSGLDIDPDTAEIEENINFDPDMLNINLKLSELKVAGTSSAQPTPRTGRSQLTNDARQPSTYEMEKSTPYPMCYGNVLAGRTTGTSSTPGQSAQPVVSDEEAEVPSRNLIKRQALLMVDSKARRKGYRAPTKRK